MIKKIVAGVLFSAPFIGVFFLIIAKILGISKYVPVVITFVLFVFLICVIYIFRTEKG